MKKKKRQSPQKDHNVNYFTGRLPAFWSFHPICPSVTCTLSSGSTKQLFAFDTVAIIINPLESSPTGNSEKLTQLKNHKSIERTKIEITSKIPVVVTAVIA